MIPWLIAASLAASALSEKAKADREKEQNKEDAESTAVQQLYSGYTKDKPKTYSPKALEGTMGHLANVAGAGLATTSNWMDYENQKSLQDAMVGYYNRGNGKAEAPLSTPGAPADDGTPAGPVARSVRAPSPWGADAGPVNRNLPTDGNGWTTSLWGQAPGAGMTQDEQDFYLQHGYPKPKGY